VHRQLPNLLTGLCASHRRAWGPVPRVRPAEPRGKYDLRMSNRRVDDELYGRPNRSGVLLAGGLMLVAMIVGIVVLQKVDKAPSGGNVAAGTEVVATNDTSAEDPTGTELTTTTLAVVQRDPALVKVIVTNGSGVNKAAKKVSDFLIPQRFQMLTPRDANQKNYADTVFFLPGFETEAQAIVNVLGPVDFPQADGTVLSRLPEAIAMGQSTIAVPPVIPAFDIQVMVGPGLAKKYKLAPAAGVAATTTVAPA
jgi:hypothetical protein